jgi:hypothetical protein
MNSMAIQVGVQYRSCPYLSEHANGTGMTTTTTTTTTTAAGGGSSTISTAFATAFATALATATEQSINDDCWYQSRVREIIGIVISQCKLFHRASR